MATEKSPLINEYGDNVGIQMQVDIVSDLLSGKGISKDIIQGFKIVKDVVERAVSDFREVGIEEGLLQSISRGEVCVLSGRSKEVLLDYFLHSFESKGFSLFRDGKLLPHLLTDDDAIDFYKSVKISVVANLIQITSTNNKGFKVLRKVLNIKDGSGLTFQIGGQSNFGVSLELDSMPRDPNNTPKVIKQLFFVNIQDSNVRRSSLEDVRTEEFWHAFDALRHMLINQKADLYINDQTLSGQGKELFDLLSSLSGSSQRKEKTELFVNNEFIQDIQGLKIGLMSIYYELPAKLAVLITRAKLDEKSLEMDKNKIATELIDTYILPKFLRLETLRRYCDEAEDGRIVFNASKLLERMSDPRAYFSGEFPEHTYFNFLEEFTQKGEGVFGIRTYKPDKESELIKRCQQIIDIGFNDKSSPLVRLSLELKAAVSAFIDRSRLVDSYQALVEMSLLPYTRWPAYVRLKNSGMKFPRSKDLPQ